MATTKENEIRAAAEAGISLARLVREAGDKIGQPPLSIVIQSQVIKPAYQRRSIMAGVEVTITGILYDRMNRTQQNVVLMGEAILTGLGVGGGPIVSEPQPPGVWPSPGHPTHPIAPGGRPPGFWGGAGEGFPTPPIVIPKPPTEPPPDGGDKPPPTEGGWGYVAEWNAWGYFPAEDEARPK